jgi:hypothetical protein
MSAAVSEASGRMGTAAPQTRPPSERGEPVSNDSHDNTDTIVEPTGWLTVPEVAEQLGLVVTRVHQLFRDGNLLAVRRDGVLMVPAELISVDSDGRPVVVKHLSGVLTLLHDAGYSDEEAMRWLYTADESLPGTPAQALRENRGTEVKRRAQAAGF